MFKVVCQEWWNKKLVQYSLHANEYDCKFYIELFQDKELESLPIGKPCFCKIEEEKFERISRSLCGIWLEGEPPSPLLEE